MKYMLLLFGDENAWADMSEEETAAELAGLRGATAAEATKAGVFVSGEGLQPTRRTATTHADRRAASGS